MSADNRFDDIKEIISQQIISSLRMIALQYRQDDLAKLGNLCEWAEEWFAIWEDEEGGSEALDRLVMLVK